MLVMVLPPPAVVVPVAHHARVRVVVGQFLICGKQRLDAVATPSRRRPDGIQTVSRRYPSRRISIKFASDGVETVSDGVETVLRRCIDGIRRRLNGV